MPASQYSSQSCVACVIFFEFTPEKKGVLVESMPPTNYDSSELTRRRKAATLAGFNTALEAYRNTVNINSSRTEQSKFQVLSVVTDRKMGGCYCSDINFYRRNVGAVCSGNC